MSRSYSIFDDYDVYTYLLIVVTIYQMPLEQPSRINEQ